MENRTEYGDILYAVPPVPIRLRMERKHRAKIFAPFAALRGFENGIEAMTAEAETEERILGLMRDLSDPADWFWDTGLVIEDEEYDGGKNDTTGSDGDRRTAHQRGSQ